MLRNIFNYISYAIFKATLFYKKYYRIHIRENIYEVMILKSCVALRRNGYIFARLKLFEWNSLGIKNEQCIKNVVHFMYTDIMDGRNELDLEGCKKFLLYSDVR